MAKSKYKTLSTPKPETFNKAPTIEKAPPKPERVETTEDEKTLIREIIHRGEKKEAAPFPKKKKAAPSPAAVAPEPEKSATRLQIDQILQEDIREIYQGMNQEEQEKFRQKGIEVGNQLEELMINFKAKIKNVFVLIKSWLFMIPRVNRYYLEQEAKKKTEEMMELVEQTYRQQKLKK